MTNPLITFARRRITAFRSDPSVGLSLGVLDDDAGDNRAVALFVTGVGRAVFTDPDALTRLSLALDDAADFLKYDEVFR